MSSVWGTALRVSLFGESHGPAVGVVVDGLPCGEAIDPAEIRREMGRRAPGGALATGRREPDEVEVLSGFVDGKTTGAPVCGVIRNRDARPADYGTALRPGHGDLTAFLKYKGHADLRGGGHFSGRLTAGLCFAGAVAKQILARRGVRVLGRILSVGHVADPSAPRDQAAWAEASARAFPVADRAAGAAMEEMIRAVREAGDSVGGVVECAAFGVPAGLGEPFFDSVESGIGAMLFSIPGVKGVEFGDGFDLAGMRGSEANDPIVPTGGGFGTGSNRCGGALGGITTGDVLLVRAAVKPTPSIGTEQDTVDRVTGKPVTIRVQGRHDPCIAPRAVPVVEAGVALCVLDFLLQTR